MIAALRPTYNLWADFPNEEMDPAVARLFDREPSRAKARDERYRRGLAAHLGQTRTLLAGRTSGSARCGHGPRGRPLVKLSHSA